MQPDQRTTITTKQQRDCLLLQASCAACGERLGPIAGVEFDHHPPLAARKTEDWSGIHPNDPRYLRAMHIDCHAVKTNGRPHTTLGSDKHENAKTKRLEAIRRAQRLLPGSPGIEPLKRKIPSQPFQTGKKHPFKRKVDGTHERRAATTKPLGNRGLQRERN